MASLRRSWLDHLLVAALAGSALVAGSRQASGDPNPPDEDDGLPTGMVAYFAGGKCPTGWAPAAKLEGRLAVGVSDPTKVDVTVGNPLGDREDRWHKHTWTGTLQLDDKGVAAADGGGNGQGAAAKAYTFQGETSIHATGLPFIQVQACVKK